MRRLRWTPGIMNAAHSGGKHQPNSGRTDADCVLTITDQGFEGHLYDAGEKDKVVITLSGSEGGSTVSDTIARWYRRNGISALGVTLFAGEQTGDHLDRVPLEYAERAVVWLKDHSYEKIAVDGISKGSEYALLAASMFDGIGCVIARVPSYFVSEGMIGHSRPSGTSCWSYQGIERHYVPYKIRKFNVVEQLARHHEFNILEYNVDKEVAPETVIPMERINGPILLISTEADTVWPSSAQAEYIEDYLQAHDFSHEVKHLKFDNVSHLVMPMPHNRWLLRLMFKSEREFPEACAAQRAAISEQIIDFIEYHW